MFRYGLSGTNWTRKTTTIAKLIPRLSPASVNSVSLSKLVSQSPHPMRENQTVEASAWMVDQVRSVLDAPPLFEYEIFDRTPLDIMAFTRYAIARNQGSGESTICDRVAQLSTKFDVIFFCRPAGDWPSPIVPTNEQRRFALQIDGLMESSIEMMHTEVVGLPWDSNDRLSAIIDRLGEHRGGR
jgi:hypothetical protein